MIACKWTRGFFVPNELVISTKRKKHASNIKATKPPHLDKQTVFSVHRWPSWTDPSATENHAISNLVYDNEHIFHPFTLFFFHILMSTITAIRQCGVKPPKKCCSNALHCYVKYVNKKDLLLMAKLDLLTFAQYEYVHCIVMSSMSTKRIYYWCQSKICSLLHSTKECIESFPRQPRPWISSFWPKFPRKMSHLE